MSNRLRDLIRNVRSCKTSAEERAVIAKECASIRSSFKDNDSNLRHRNIAKLLYIHMLGHPTHFGQVECLKLIGSHRFAEKRIGYLGLMTMLDERQEVLMLATNSLKQDLNDKNPYVVGLSLCAMGNISSCDILRDLQQEVEKLLKSTNPYIRKKAVLVMLRTVRKVPELLSSYTGHVRHALTDKSPSVVLAGLALAAEMLKSKPKLKTKFVKLVPAFVKSLKALTSTGYSGERDICGISDPFLQVRFIRILRVLGIQNSKASEEMNDVLAQVATNTESSKNPGSSVLYECVRTIMSIEAEDGLRVMAINILGRFLLNRDNNIRYVALKTLCECVSTNASAIQRHRNTIVECLKDADISIRRRALDLTYALVNKSNVRSLVGELVSYLELSHGDKSFKSDLAAKVTAVIERFSPDPKWHIDMLVRVLESAGHVVAEDIPFRLAILVAENGHLRPYSVHKLFLSLSKELPHSCLVDIGIWSIGEYSALLTSESGVSAANAQADKSFYSLRTPSEIIDAVEACLDSHHVKPLTVQYALTALLKLTKRYPSESRRMLGLIERFSANGEVEIQARSCEYSNLLGDAYTSLRIEALEPMPCVDMSKISRKQEAEFFDDESDEDSDEDDDEDEDEEAQEHENQEDHVIREPKRKPKSRDSSSERRRSKDDRREQKKKGGKSKKKKTESAEEPSSSNHNVVDLLDLFGESSSTPSAAPSHVQADQSSSSVDVLADIFGSSLGPSVSSPHNQQGSGGLDLGFLGQPSSSPASSPRPAATAHDLLDFGSSVAASPSPPPSPPSGQFAPIEALNKSGIVVTMSFQRSQDQIGICVTSVNTGDEPVSNYEFKAAVPKYIKMRLKPATGTELSANGSDSITQMIMVTNTLAGQKPLLMKIKVDGSRNGSPFCEQAQVSGFPQGF